MVDDVRVGVTTRFDSQLSLMNCQIFLTGLSSGDFGGNDTGVMFAGSVFETCHPA